MNNFGYLFTCNLVIKLQISLEICFLHPNFLVLSIMTALHIVYDLQVEDMLFLIKGNP